MQAGKLPHDLLADLLGRIEVRDPRVVLGPKLGEDAALIDLGDRYLVAKSDPITFATDLIGWYLVQVNANDLAVMGATPKWLMATLLLPEGTAPEQAAAVFEQLTNACDDLGITLVGGHTEITLDLPRPIAVGALLGEVNKDRVVFTSGAKPGDSIVLTKGIALEGTSILAREAGEALEAAGVAASVIERSRNLLFDPGISVVKDAYIVLEAGGVHAMHDPTEGGLATGLMEMASAAEVGLTVDLERVPVLPETAAVCEALGLEPMGLIASGALLAAVAPEDVPKLLRTLEAEGVPAWEIGAFTEPEYGQVLRTADGVQPLPTFSRDELARYFSGAG